jgi:hypothetical protein
MHNLSSYRIFIEKIKKNSKIYSDYLFNKEITSS